jgi:hypothetical protein
MKLITRRKTLVGIGVAAQVWASNAQAFLLDTISNVTVAYSTRQLKTGVTSPLQVTCAADSSTYNAIFTGGWVDVTNITTHCSGQPPGGNPGYSITTIYDQSGGAHHLAALGGTGAVLTASCINSHPCIFTPGTGAFSNASVVQASTYNVHGVQQTAGAIAALNMVFNSDIPGTLRIAHYIRYDTPNQPATISFNASSNNYAGSATTTLTNPHVYSAIYDGSNTTPYLDGVAGTPVALAGPGNSGSNELDWGATNANANNFNGNLSEVILVGPASTTSRSTIDADELCTFLNVCAATAVPTRTLMGEGQ